MNNVFDTVGKFINESCGSYYGSTGAQSTGGVSAALMKQLKGFTAVDTPLGGNQAYDMMNKSIRGQIAHQAEYTLQQRNYLLSQIDKISGHWISYAVKSIIASDCFNDLVSKYELYIKYTDTEDEEKSESFSEEIDRMLKRTSFLDILKDCVMNEGLDYCEQFLSTPIKYGYGIEYVSDNMCTREHIGIYKNTNLLGAIKFEITPKGLIRGKEFIKADQISHFLMGYKKIPLAISKNFNQKYHIPEKIRCAYPILTPVIDLITQYDQLSKLQTGLEMIRATAPIIMGIGVSPENNMTEVVRQLQEWSLTLNENKNNIINNLDTCDVSTIMQSMMNLLMIPYSVGEGVNALKQVAVNFPDSNLTEVLDDIRRSIALALGIPEQYIALNRGGTKETKEDTITTNPRYSKMLSMIQQSLSRGITDFIYKHLKAKFTNNMGIVTELIDKDKIEVIFKSSTNLNDKIEDERLMLKAENMGNMVNVIETIASSPSLPAKIKGENFIEYWRTQMEREPHLRDIFEMMTPEELEKFYGADEIPNTGDEEITKNGAPVEEEPQEQEEQGEEEQGKKGQPVKEPVEQEVQTKEQPKKLGKEDEKVRNLFK